MGLRLIKIAFVLLCLCAVLNAQTLCVEGDVQILSASSFLFVGAGAGRVEVCHNGVWGTIAQPGSLWSEKNAQVACITAGYMGALNSIFTSGLSFNDVAAATTPVHYIVDCNGLETNLSSCSINDNVAQYQSSSTTYIHIDDVFVVCRLETIYSAVHPAGVQIGDIRLLGDSANGIGAVEIYSNRFEWVTICPDGFDDSDASVLCGRLGYDSGRVALYSPSETSTVRQLLYDADCSGANVGLITNRIIAGVCSFAVSLSGCPSQTTDLAGVECFSSSASVGSVRLFGGDGSSGVVETLYNGKWGMICGIDTSGAETVCSQLGFYRPESSFSVADTNLLERESNLKPIWLSGVVCPEGSSSLLDCSRSGQLVGYAPCVSGDIVAVSCGTQFSGGEIAGIVIGIPVGLVIIAVIAWFAGVRECWAKRNNNARYRSLVACCTGCQTRCHQCQTGCHERAQEARAAREEARETQRARREAEQAAQRAQREAERAERARQTDVHVQMETVATQPSAPYPEPVPTKDGEFSKAGPPQYPYAIGFQQVAADLPPPYEEAAAGATYPPR